MNKRPTEPAPNAPSRRPTPPMSPGATGKRTPKEEAEKKAMEKKYPFNKYAKGGATPKRGARVRKFAVGGATTPPPATRTPPPATRTAPPPAASATPLRDASPRTSGLPGTGGVQLAAKPAASATPLRDASPRTSGLPGTGGVQLAAGKAPVSNVTTAAPKGPAFDRNAALQAFNAQAGNFFKQGVPKAELIKQQGILRALQMNNTSDNAMHQRALADALSAMQRLTPKKAAKGGTMKYAKGGNVSSRADGVAKKGKTKVTKVAMACGGKAYAKGGSVRSADGIAKKGRTKGKMV